ncbi:MAG: AMP-binding protein, partial [bacterium]|nr:AMP-binding protein [bacterium]
KPGQRLSSIDYISTAEKDQILFDFNRTDSPFPHEATLHGLFEEQMERTPDRIAVYGEDVSLSYGKLNNASQQLARRLSENGVVPGSIVAIMTDRSVNTIIGIMGVLKAGGAYLPIDPGYPQERIDFMLKDSGALGTGALGTGNTLNAGSFYSPLERGGSTKERRGVSNANPAYVIYTSGTTGKPKAVMIEHRSVVNLVSGLKEEIYPYDSPIDVSLISPYIFDASVKQVFPTLLLGHTLNIVPEEARLNGLKLVDFYKKRNIYISDGTPAHLDILLDIKDRWGEEFPVERFVIGGEELKVELCAEFIEAVNK